MPLALLLLVAIAFVVWRLNATGQQFLPAFARLLDEPRLERGPSSLFSGLSYATGRFRGREVAIRLQLRRGRHSMGYLVVAMRTGGAETLTASDVDAQVQDDAGRRALFSIAQHDLLLSVEDGWLKTMWKPSGFVVFPGSFSEETWRPVLEAMHTVAASLSGSRV